MKEVEKGKGKRLEHRMEGSVELLFAICFCVPSYVDQQLHSIDCQNFVHYNSLVFLPISGPLMLQGFIFGCIVPVELFYIERGFNSRTEI